MEMVVEATQNEGKTYLNIETEDIRRMGILRSTHEEVITLEVKNNKLVFNYCWGIACGSTYNYKSHETKEFDEDHPGFIQALQRAYEDKTLMFRYWTWDGKTNHKHITNDLMVALRKGE